MKARHALLIVLLCGASGVCACYLWLAAQPEVRAFDVPAKTAWEPRGPREAGHYDYTVVPEPDTFHTMHAGVANRDEVWIAAAPMVALDWVAEPEMFIGEGPTFDNEGNLYFSPYNPKEDVSLVSLERTTGRRRWTVPGGGAGAGAILILNDPEHPGVQSIYHSTYTTAMALRTDGSVIWETSTGLTLPVRRPGDRDCTHVWGMNYHPQADAVFGVTMDGYVYAHDRRTGRPLLRAPFRIPGAPAVVAERLPRWLSDAADRETERVFGKTLDGSDLFTAIVDVILGSGYQVTNFYAIDPNTGRIYIAATAPDKEDGKADGVSENGAVYLLELRGTAPDYAIEIVQHFFFSGGTGSTPSVSPSGHRVVVSDDHGNVIVLDSTLHERWRLDVGAQVAASIAVAADGNELYAVTIYDIIKIRDHGDYGEIVWRARLDAYPGFDNFNALTPTVTANGIAVGIGAGRKIGSRLIMHKVGVGLLDRETGQLRYFAEGREESIAVTAIGPDGGFYLADSPVRRAVSRGMFGDRVPPLVGGIQRFKPVRPDLLVRDAACAAAARARNATSVSTEYPDSALEDLRQLRVLIKQARASLPGTGAPENQGAEALTPENRAAIQSALDEADANLTLEGLTRVAEVMGAVCAMWE